MKGYHPKTSCEDKILSLAEYANSVTTKYYKGYNALRFNTI
jgi:hypothetical protein